MFLKKTVINTDTFFQLTTYLRFLLIVKRFFYFLLKIIAHISKFYTVCHEVYLPLNFLMFFVLFANAPIKIVTVMNRGETKLIPET